jgi:Cd2+/Zn2+-exporting ATPase
LPDAPVQTNFEGKSLYPPMTEKTIELEIPLLLPGVEDEQDPCLARLETWLQNQKGIRRSHLEREKSPVDLCLHYDPNVLTLADVKRLAKRAGADITNRYHHEMIPIEGMDCSDCALVIEHSVGRLDGVVDVAVNYAAQKMRLEYDAQKTDRKSVEKRVRSLGYQVPAGGVRSWYPKNRALIFSLAAGAWLLAGWLGQTVFGLAAPAAALYLAAYLSGGWDVSRHAWHALRERRFDTDLLMVVAAIGAAILGDFAEGALLLFLFSLGHALEERALERARGAVRALAELAPKTALVRRNGGEIELPVEQLQLGEVAIIRPGVRIPVDGVILAGQSGVDQSPMTGESAPVDKAPGDKVYAGSINGEGALEVQVTRLAKDSTLRRVMRMVEEAQTQKSPTQQLTERFERWFVPGVLVADALLILLPPLFGVPFQESFLRAMTLLVAASPCALALGTPAAVLAGVAQAACNGVLVKGGAHLESLGRLRAIAFDKTGTLTHGRPEVTRVAAFDGEADQILSLAAGLESRSAHPLAQAVVRAAQARGLALAEVGEVESITGRGLRATLEAQVVRAGSLAFMEEAGVSIPAAQRRQLEELQAQGQTTILLARDSRLSGALALADTLRPDAAASLAALKRMGLGETILLSGDNERVAAEIARQAGVADFRAGLMPEDKAEAMRSLVQRYGEVAMVGDGVNDAPALAKASLGIAMGGAGTDVALETADVALMGNDLAKLPFAVGLGRASRAIIRQNLVIAVGVMAVLVVASLAGWAAIGVAVAIHEGSTLAVVANALRLLGYHE